MAGEGLIRWMFENELGEKTHVEVPGYHRKSATVRLLSPQVIFHHLGGSSLQDKNEYRLSIRGDIFTAPYCPRSRLLILSLSDNTDSSHSFPRLRKRSSYGINVCDSVAHEGSEMVKVLYW